MQSWDKKIHIVAPPWSGKTIVGLEMLSKINQKSLILVPNITLQYQWKDKLETLFLEEDELLVDLVSLTPQEIKPINIITYQALTQSWEWDDVVLKNALTGCFKDFAWEFENRGDFEKYIQNLKETAPKEFEKLLSKYIKNEKKSQNVEAFLTPKSKEYFQQLRVYGVQLIILDEAHHLTSWWSSVVYYLRSFLWESYIIGLTATPPYENTDFFLLNQDYSKLLGEVDYYVPQPAVVKSGKLAPSQDLVIFVQTDDTLKQLLEQYEANLCSLIEKYKDEIVKEIYELISQKYESLLKDQSVRLRQYLKFLRHYSRHDLSEYIFEDDINAPLQMEDLAKTIGKFFSIKKIQESRDFEQEKRVFYQMGYIRRGNNFYRFRTPVEMQLIYSKTKIFGVYSILDAEISCLWKQMHCAIITDFFAENANEYLSARYIFANLGKKYWDLHPILVSWQWNYCFDEQWQIQELWENILEITKRFSRWESQILIGTRGILGEWWDCPEVNTLIDLTGVVAYMSVNQVRGRGMRLNLLVEKKVCNVYDIVCVGKGYKGNIDIERLISKHEKFYGIDGSGLIIKWVDHICPNLTDVSLDFDAINSNMLARVQVRDYIYNLWGIHEIFANKEVFWLHLHIENYGHIFPIKKLWFLEKIQFSQYFNQSKISLSEIENNSVYHTFIQEFIQDFVQSIAQTLTQNWFLSRDFQYEIRPSGIGEFKVLTRYHDEMIGKLFISNLAEVFSPIIKQKYILQLKCGVYDGRGFVSWYLNFWLSDGLCKNKKFRKNFLSKISFLHSMWLYEYMYIFSPRLLEYLKLSRCSKEQKSLFISLNSCEIDRKDFVWKSPFIHAQIEKLWM